MWGRLETAVSSLGPPRTGSSRALSPGVTAAGTAWPAPPPGSPALVPRAAAGRQPQALLVSGGRREGARALLGWPRPPRPSRPVCREGAHPSPAAGGKHPRCDTCSGLLLLLRQDRAHASVSKSF